MNLRTVDPVDERAKSTLALLDEMGIDYRYYAHDLALTMHDCERVAADIGAVHFKNLFLANRQGTDFYLVLLGADKKFKTADVSKQLGVARLSFGTEAQLMEKLGLVPGSVTPLALAHPGAHDVLVAIDSDVLKSDTVVMHPCISTASVAMSRDDLFRFLDRCGNTRRMIEVTTFLDGEA